MGQNKQYYISHEGQQLGPWSIKELSAKLQAGELAPTDYLYDESKSDWLLMLDYPELKSVVEKLKPAAPPKPMAAPKAKQVDADPTVKKLDEIKKTISPDNEHSAHEWFVLKGENKFGPFSYHDVIRMLQEKVVYEFDFVWHQGLETWQRIADMKAFEDNNIRKLQNTLMPDISEVFFRRRHRRVKYDGTILVHDNSSVWKGKGVEISAGGAGVVMENAMIVPGQTLYLHFRPCVNVPPFNAVCEVVNKKYQEGLRDKNAPVQYGLKFKSINDEVKKVIQDYAKVSKAA